MEVNNTNEKVYKLENLGYPHHLLVFAEKEIYIMNDENLKLYGNAINELKILLEEKEEILKCIVNILNRSERNSFQYLKLLLNKDTLLYEIEQIKNIIICQTKDLENEKERK